MIHDVVKIISILCNEIINHNLSGKGLIMGQVSWLLNRQQQDVVMADMAELSGLPFQNHKYNARELFLLIRDLETSD